MGPGQLLRRGVALLAAVGLLAVSVASASADDGDEETAVAAIATELRPTQVAAEIPEGYETLFPLQWGGGSLPQLKGRLADLGCAMNTLWLHDEDGWHGYNRYDLTYDFPTNQQFIQRYEVEVPAGTLWTTCADQPIGNELQPTQIIAEIPEEYGTMFELQWGGGSLIHFKGRLATMGCIANNISLHDPDTGQAHIYNQYNTLSTDLNNQRFLRAFEQFLPAGIFSVDCYNICEFRDRKCVSFEEMNKRQGGYTSHYGFHASIINSPCTTDFDTKVTDKVFPLLPLIPNVCIVVKQLNDGKGVRGIVPSITINTKQFFVIFDDKSPYRSNREYTTIRLAVEIHELCHINQDWQQVRQLGLPQGYNQHYLDDFKHSQHGKEFMDIIGYQQFGNSYILPIDSIYRNIYFKTPIEISAELCKLYLLDKMGERSNYDYERYASGVQHEVPIRDFDTSPYLTPEVVEWLETYMILPEITE